MHLFSGDIVDPLAEGFVPRIEDIAHSLSMQCRYNGHTREFYSVAEHSVHVARWVMAQYGTPQIKRRAGRTALLHDAAEAYLGDVARPIKWRLPGYAQMEEQVAAAIADEFGLDTLSWCEHLQDADNRIILDEMHTLFDGQVDPSLVHLDPLGVAIEGWHPNYAAHKFLQMWEAVQ